MRRTPPAAPSAVSSAVSPAAAPPAAAPGPLPDRVGPYAVLREVARGGMASVYEVVDPVDGGRLALKLLHQRGAAQLRFVREYEALTRLDHPNILRVFRFGQADGHGPYLTMELLDGVAAQVYAKSLGRPGALDRSRAVLRVVSEVALALQHLHERGLVHRDLKSSNVLVTTDGRVKLLDFGTARPLDPAETITENGEFVGTFAYASPEQLRGEPVDARADLYALGVLAYRLLTGRRPFEGDNPAALARLHLDAPPRPPSELVPGLPAELEALVLALLHKAPADRPPTAAAVIDRLASMGVVALPRPAAQGAPDGLGAVGRARELDVIEGVVDARTPGDALLVSGPVGAGAGLLLDEAARRLRARGLRVLSERFAAGDGLAPLARLGRAALRSNGAPQADQAAALGLLSRVPVAGDPAAGAPALAAALLALLVRPGEVTVLALRELGSAGPVATAALSALRVAAREAGAPLLILASVEGPAERDALLDGAPALRLAPLSVAEVSLLVRAMLGRSPAPAALCRRLRQLSGGRAGYLVELVHAMLAQGALVPDPKAGWRDLSGGRVGLPEAMRGPMERCLDGLDAAPLRALEALAVARVPCGLGALSAALERPADELRHALRVLIESDLCVGDLEGDAAQIEVGALGELLRQRVRPTRRASLERALAGEVEAAPPGLDKVRLLLAAGRGPEAARCALAWAAAAPGERAGWAALGALRACLDATPTGAPERAALQRLVAEALAVDDPRDPEALVLARGAAEHAVGAERARAELCLSALHRRRGEQGAAAVHRGRAEQEASRIGALDVACAVELEAALAFEAALDLPSAEVALSRALELAALTEDDPAYAAALALAGALQVRRGALRTGEAELRQALRAMPEPPPIGVGAALTVSLGRALRLQGRFAEADELLRAMLTRARAEAGGATQAEVLLELVDLFIDLFRLGEARELLSELSALEGAGLEPALRCELGRARGRLSLMAEEPEQALAQLTPALLLAEDAALLRPAHRIRALIGLGEAALGRTEAADRETRVSLRELERAGLWPDAADAALCRAAALRGAEPPARCVAPVWGWLQRSGARLALLEARVALAEHAHGRGDLEACRGELTAASCVLDELRAAQGAEADVTLRAHPLVGRMRRLHPGALDGGPSQPAGAARGPAPRPFSSRSPRPVVGLPSRRDQEDQ